MRITLKGLLVLLAIAAVLSLITAVVWRSRAPDSWGFAKLGVTNGTPNSASYYLEVRGINDNPTIARLVRFDDLSDTPKNALDVSKHSKEDLDYHTQNRSRVSDKCLLIAGRSMDEEVKIWIDMPVARKLFARDGDGAEYDGYDACQELWADYVIPHLPAGHQRVEGDPGT